MHLALVLVDKGFIVPIDKPIDKGFIVPIWLKICFS